MSKAKVKTGKKSFFSKVPIILWGLIGIAIVLGILSPASVKPEHLLDFTRQAAPLIVVGLGQTIVLMSGGLDLSVAANIILIDIVAARVMNGGGIMTIVGIVLCLGLGVAIGFTNGFLTAKLKMPAFIVTLGMASILTGAMLIFCNGLPKGEIPKGFRVISVGFVGKVPIAFFVWIIVAIITGFLLLRYPIGRYIRGLGINKNALGISGQNTDKIQIVAYILSGLFAAFAGLQLAAYIGKGVQALGEDYQMNSIAVALLGGASFAGGKGSILGTILGAIFLKMLLSVIAILNLAAGPQEMIQGIVIIVALIINGFRDRNS